MGGRRDWADLPPAVKAHVENRFGAVTKAVAAPPGLTTGLACRADTSAGPIFVKAGPVDGPGGNQYVSERAVGRWLPPGETLVHGDIHPGNLHVTPGGVRLLDWGVACHAPRWFDAAALVLRLVIAGHTPPDAEGVVAELAGWRTAPDRDVAAYVALMTGFSAWAAARGPERHRPKRAAAAVAGEAWLAHRV